MSTDGGSFFIPNHSPTLADSICARSSLAGPRQTSHKERGLPWYRVHGFTYILAEKKKPLSADVYARSLLLQGHGTALWSPFGYFPRSEEHIIKGVSIGDVGTIDKVGNFMFMFNIFREPDDPVHRGSTPREFQPIVPPLDSSEVFYKSDYFKPGTAIVSDGVRVERNGTDHLRVKFQCKAQEGAVLYLPHGASREDLISTDRLHQYIQHNAAHWYQKLNDYLSGQYPNGSLVVVTGCDKASDWANAVFDGKGKLEYKWSQKFKSPWYCDGHSMGQCFQPVAERLCGVKIPVDVDARHQCVFIRTLHVSLSSDLWMNIMQYTITPPFYSTLTISKSLFQQMTDAIMVWLKLFYEEDKARRIILNRAKERQPFHPNDILAQVLLRQFPEADVCLISDSAWSSYVHGGIGTVSNMVNLVDRVLSKQKAVVTQGCLTLAPWNGDARRLLDFITCSVRSFAFRKRPQVQIIRANRIKYGLVKQ